MPDKKKVLSTSFQTPQPTTVKTTPAEAATISSYGYAHLHNKPPSFYLSCKKKLVNNLRMFGKNKKGALQHQIFLFIFIIFKSFRISHPKLQMQQCNIASVSTQQVRNSARRKLRWKCTVADVQKVWLVCSMKIFHKVTYGSRQHVCIGCSIFL